MHSTPALAATKPPVAPDQGDAPLLSVSDLRVEFAMRHGIVKAVDGVSFDLMRNETLCIVGESGSGKSVTMQALMGLVPMPPGRLGSGRALFGDQKTDLLALDESAMRQYRGARLAMIFQDPMTSLNPYLKLSKQLTEGEVRSGRLTEDQARKRALDLLGRVGIPDAARRMDSYPHQFSGGMRQRIMIAMALMGRPDILTADEPTTALDVTVQAAILDLLKDLQAETRMAIVLITHDMGVVARMADRVAVMYAGRIVEMARVREIFARPRHPYTSGLLHSVPRVDGPIERLESIPGQPPDLASLTRGCAFAPRCSRARPECTAENATEVLAAAFSAHQTRCLFPMNS